MKRKSLAALHRNLLKDYKTAKSDEARKLRTFTKSYQLMKKVTVLTCY